MGEFAAIKVVGLGKKYVLGGAEKSDVSFREMLTGALTAPLRRLKRLQGARAEEETFWALRDVGFDIKPGEVVGIIGRNGAGKSTLLKILSRITDPTEGRIEIRGRVSSLLEVGTGFHPELTGRENVFLNGAILGMTRQEIRSKFDEIVAFAEVEKFLDTPVKRYSSGMYVRLAFAVAAHLEPEILIVDEVLAVGDVAFQKKCLGKMESVGKEGRTVLFVSHNMNAIRHMCARTICLHKGEILADGNSDEVIEGYLGGSGKNELIYMTDKLLPYPHLRKVIVLQDSLSKEDFLIDRPIEIVMDVDFQGMSEIEVGLYLMNSHGICVHHSCSEFGEVLGDGDIVQVRCTIPPYGVGPGKHTLDLGVHKRNYQVYEMLERVISFNVIFSGTLSDKTTGQSWTGACGPGLLKWKTIQK